MTFTSENKLQKEHFLAKCNYFFGDLCIHLESLSGLECAYVYHNLKTEKEGMYIK